MGSRMGKPFWARNLIVFEPENVQNDSADNSCFARGDALIADPDVFQNHTER